MLPFGDIRMGTVEGLGAIGEGVEGLWVGAFLFRVFFFWPGDNCVAAEPGDKDSVTGEGVGVICGLCCWMKFGVGCCC